jgi:hypothetical protein
MLALLMTGIYVVHRSDGFRCHDIHTKFNMDWFNHSRVNKGEYTGSRRQQCVLVSLIFNKESRLKTRICFACRYINKFIFSYLKIWPFCFK